ncbi:MAG: dTDP-4-dehydrorhamnose reductase [Balneola sp.]|jgi:dTDP-4-dehydrorhamnose reductase
MKLLITGAGGQLGQEWVDFCTNNGISFKGYSSNELNILDEDQLEYSFKTVQPDFFINCAAYTKVDKAEEEVELAGLVNSESLKYICKLCSDHSTKFIHYSTDYVFSGSKEDRMQVPDGYPEDFATNPINVYGATKRRGEVVIKESDCDYLIVRVSWLCGQYGYNFVKTMLRLGIEKDELNVVNDQFGSPAFADQVVEQTFELLQQNKSGTYHLSSDGITTWYHFSKEIFEQKGINVKVNPVSSADFPTKAKRPYFSKLSTQKISNVDGVLILDWKAGLQRLLKQL